MDILTMRWKTRFGSPNQQERRAIDFVINGVPLWETLQLDKYDLSGCIGWSLQSQRSIQELIGNIESELHSKRVQFYICPECGDIGCGAITAAVSRENNTLTWSNFAFENDFDPETDPDIGYRTSFPFVGPFQFDPQQVEQVLYSYTQLA
jgi:hypothetical protein